MKIVASTIFFVIFAHTAFGQAEPCRISLVNLPAIQGLRLKMPKADVMRLLNATANSDNESLDTYIGKDVGFFRSRVFESSSRTGEINFETIRSFFETLDDEVIKLSITSKRTIGYINPNAFKKAFEKDFRIPKKCWTISEQHGMSFRAYASFGDFGVSFQSDFSIATANFFILNIDAEVSNRLIARENEKRKVEEEARLEAARRPIIEPPRPVIKVPIEPKVVKDEKSFVAETCSVRIPELPKIRGLRLGIERSELDFILPGCKNELGSRCFLRSEEIANESLRAGLDAISIIIDLDSDEINEISVIYDDSVKWLSMREFAETISESLGLPKEKWIQVSEKGKSSAFSPMKLSCSNYLISVSMVDEKRPNLILSKTKELLAFEENVRQQKNKKNFKP